MKQKGREQKRNLCYLVTLSLVMGAMFLANSGCSVYMAAKQPDEKDLSVLTEGTPRDRVHAELGAPVWSGIKDGNKVDVFAFKQGYSKGGKTARAFIHGTADVLTLGLWEVVGTPIEIVASGTDMKVEVIYDGNDKVKLAKILTQKETEVKENK